MSDGLTREEMKIIAAANARRDYMRELEVAKSDPWLIAKVCGFEAVQFRDSIEKLTELGFVLTDIPGLFYKVEKHPDGWNKVVSEDRYINCHFYDTEKKVRITQFFINSASFALIIFADESDFETEPTTAK